MGLIKILKNLAERKKNVLSTMRGKTAYSKEITIRAFHAAPQLMVISNLSNGEIIDVNEAFLSTMGYRKEEVTGKTFQEIRLFADMNESNKYIRLLPRFRKVTDFPVSLMTRAGEIKSFLFSAGTIRLGSEYFLLTSYNPYPVSEKNLLRDKSNEIIEDIFETVSSYLLRISISADDRFYIRDINRKAEEFENVSGMDVTGKYIEDTILAKRIKLVELLHHIKITGEPLKLAVSSAGDSSEGFYVGFLLSTGDIIVTLEPPVHHKKYGIKNGLAEGEGAKGIMNYEIDLHGKLIYAEEKSLQYIGFTADDFRRGIYIKNLFPPDEFKRVSENLKLIKTENDFIRNEYISIRKDGTQYPILTMTFGVFSGGKLTGYRGVITDLSEQKKREHQIAREKALLEHLFDSTPEAIIITDIPGKITHINREFSRIFGYTAEEAEGRYINDLIVPEELMEEAQSVDEKVLNNQNVTIETIRKNKYGKKIYVSLSATIIKMAGVTVASFCIFRDITRERRNSLLQEILYNISGATLELSEIKDIYSIIVKELGKIWETENFFIALYDREKETISLPFFSDEKDNFQEVPIKGTITGWVIRNGKSVLLKEQDIKRMEESGEIDIIGSLCKVWMGVPLKVENRVTGAICLQDYNYEDKFSIEDLNILEIIATQVAVSIQKRGMLDDLVIARKKAEEEAQSKQTFMSTMSHEIRTPLNEVIGISNLLMQTNTTPEQLELIKTLRFSANHLTTLINEVLDYSKMESGKIEFEQIPFSLNKFLDEIKRSYSFRAQEKNIEFDVIKNSGIPEEVIGDQIRLNQIISNLLSNAFKFTESGSITITVKEKTRAGNISTLEFRVTDTGIGIPNDKLGILFDNFTQASPDTTRRFGGTGLGLAICKKLVELQGGSISVESEPGKGSSFAFSLTFELPEKKTEPEEELSAESFKGLEGKRILVAEDNRINFFVVNKFLASWGVKVAHAENGQIALNLLEKNEFDLILMDLHMPVLDGIEATRIIRNSDNPKIKEIPVIALTAAIMSENNSKIEGLNINDYILKPFKPQDLYSKISRHIRKEAESGE